MGGLGSGNRWRYGSRATCEGMKRIELSYMKRKGMLVPGRSGSMSWSIRGEPSGDIRYSMHVTLLEVNYRTRNVGEEVWKDIREFHPFEFTEQRLGGMRRWFSCLSCHRRCSILYGGERFRCRKCHNLAYSTQNETSMYRGLTKAQKLREKLGGSLCIDDPFPAKPKRMHWRTYNRLKSKGEAQENRVQDLSEIFLGKLVGIMRKAAS